jgi:hypothetical protein
MMSKKYKKYYTGIGPFENEYNYDFKKSGKFFNFTLEPYSPKENNDSELEIVINTTNLKNAEKVLNLFFAALCLHYSHISGTNENKITIITDKVGDNKEETLVRKKVKMQEIIAPCKIAMECSYKMEYTYSLLKYYLGCNIHSNYIDDINPTTSKYLPLREYDPYDHIRMGYAIVIFYSVIEELGLEIRASAKNPSLIEGQWNSVVRMNLENRLKDKGVNINKKIAWNMRSTPTRIEKEKKPLTAINSNWSRKDVRDSMIEISDAIRIISYIRSSVVSHKINDHINSVSIYEVHNANNLARRILLESLGMNE